MHYIPDQKHPAANVASSCPLPSALHTSLLTDLLTICAAASPKAFPDDMACPICSVLSKRAPALSARFFVQEACAVGVLLMKMKSRRSRKELRQVGEEGRQRMHGRWLG